MNGLNKAMLIGNLGQEPELKFTGGGQAVLKLRIATTESIPAKDGQRQERTEWHSVTLWGKRAEALSKILTKGRTVYIEGRIQTRSWEDKDGGKRYATEINATELILMPDGKGRGSRDEQRDESQGGFGSDGGNDDENSIPF